MLIRVLTVAFLPFCVGILSRYRPPRPRFEVFHPRGMKVSINADPGVTLFSFHGKLNERFEGPELGLWTANVFTPDHGRFTYYDHLARLKIGDRIHFWTIVIRNGRNYRDSGVFEVNGYSSATNRLGRRVSTIPTTTTERPTEKTENPTSLPEIRSFDNFEDFKNFKKETRSIGTQTDDFVNIRKCQESVTTIYGRKVCVGDLIFEENFEQEDLNLLKWKIERRFSTDPDNEFVVFADFYENLYTKNGTLTIKPTLFENKFGSGSMNWEFSFGTECTGVINSRDCIRNRKIDVDGIPPVLSSRISTYNNFNFLYGRIVIRARLPAGDWIFPILNLEPSNHYYGRDNFESGLMRVAFAPGGPKSSNLLTSGLILGESEPLRSAKTCSMGRYDSWSNGFHEFGMKWTPDGVYLEVDGEVYCHIRPEEGLFKVAEKYNRSEIASIWKLSSVMAPFDKEFYISLGVGVGGHHDFAAFLDKPWRDLSVKAMHTFWNDRHNWYRTWADDREALEVDYVRVYAV